MNKLKWSLRIITVCGTLLPLLFTVLVYQDNLMGLLVPPQITDAISGDNQALQEIFPDFSDMFNVEPTFNDDFQVNPEDGTFSFSMNFTSLLDIPLPVNSFSLTVSDENGSILGTINLGDSLVLVPSQTSMIPVEGTLSQELIELLQNSGMDPTNPDFNPENIDELGLDFNDIHLTNVNLDIGGIQLHIDELISNAFFESQESDSAEGQ